MDIKAWPLDKNLLCNYEDLKKSGFVEYYNLLGTDSDGQMLNKLQNYIRSFDQIRRPLKEFDPHLAEVLKINT
jgi:hypothetical protein